MLNQQPQPAATAQSDSRPDPGMLLTALANRLLDEYHEAEKARQLVNERWLEDLTQYKGQYPADVQVRLNKSKRSRVYYRLTTSKVNTMTGRLMDLLFPQRSRNWSIEPTPDPMIPDDILMQELAPQIQEKAKGIMDEMMQRLETQQIMPDQLALMKMMEQAVRYAFDGIDKGPARTRIARDRATSMERVIDDQLKELWANGHQRKSWQQHSRSIVYSSSLYGMGVLKGPLVEKLTTKRFIPAKGTDGSTQWDEQVYSEDLRPYYESVSIWDIFPDPAALNPQQLRFVWQAHLFTDKDLLELANFPGFNSKAIRSHIKDNPEGDTALAPWETRLRELNADNVSASCVMRNRYRLYERWGYLSGKDLHDAGVNVAEEDIANVYASNVWILGEQIIKAAINPLEGVDIPYFFYPFMEDETSFWPEGIASLLRAPQAGVNASARSMQDNAAASSGPIYGINMAHLAAGEDPLDMAANKVFLFDRPGANIAQAFQAVNVPSCIEYNLTLTKFWQEAGDEISTPRFNAGDGRVSGAGQTASGLSMLMGASNILLKDHVKRFDDCVCAPFIRAMFRWNMRWNPDDSIKGDFNVVASGSQSLIAKEVRAQQIPVVMSMLSNPAFASRIKADQLLEVTLEQTDLPAERLLRTDEEAKEYEEQQMLQAALAQAKANVAALVEELERRGVPPEAIQQQIIMLLAQAQGQQQALPATSDAGGEAAGAGPVPVAA